MKALTRELLSKELNKIPDNLLQELYNYIKFLKSKKSSTKDKIETPCASENVLAKDWNKPEEDEAWKSL